MPVVASLSIPTDIWTNKQPVVGTPEPAVALPVRAKYAVCMLDYPGTPATTIAITVQCSMDGITWVSIGTFTEIVDTVKRFDCEGYAFITGVVTAITGPQNTTLKVEISRT